jgi:hypothetical protein
LLERGILRDRVVDEPIELRVVILGPLRVLDLSGCSLQPQVSFTIDRLLQRRYMGRTDTRREERSQDKRRSVRSESHR